MDVREVFLRAKARQEQKRSPSKAKPESETGSKTLKSSTGKKPIKATFTDKCTRNGCSNSKQHGGLGLCQKCYELLVRQSNEEAAKAGERDPIVNDHKFKRGETVLVSGSHPNHLYRSLYAIVMEVEDSGAVLVVEFTGETTDERATSRIKRLRGQQMHILCQHLLAVGSDKDELPEDAPII
jgi:hypothetical protein